MRIVDYFKFIEACETMVDEEGYETFDELLHHGLTKKDLINLVIEFTSVIAQADVSLDILENPFETGNDWDKVSEEDKTAYKEESKLHNKSHLKIVH